MKIKGYPTKQSFVNGCCRKQKKKGLSCPFIISIFFMGQDTGISWAVRGFAANRKVPGVGKVSNAEQAFLLFKHVLSTSEKDNKKNCTWQSEMVSKSPSVHDHRRQLRFKCTTGFILET